MTSVVPASLRWSWVLLLQLQLWEFLEVQNPLCESELNESSNKVCLDPKLLFKSGHFSDIVRRCPLLKWWDVDENSWAASEGLGWGSGPMLRSRFTWSSLWIPLTTIPAPGGTVERVRGQTQLRNSWPHRDSLLTWLCFALLTLSAHPFLNLWEVRGGGGLFLGSGRKLERNY